MLSENIPKMACFFKNAGFYYKKSVEKYDVGDQEFEYILNLVSKNRSKALEHVGEELIERTENLRNQLQKQHSEVKEIFDNKANVSCIEVHHKFQHLALI